MKKRVLAVLLAATMALSMVACGGSSETEKEEVKTEETGESEDTKTGEEEPEQEEKVAPADDGVINFECDTFKVEYTRHEVGKDWEGNPCLIYYFNFSHLLFFYFFTILILQTRALKQQALLYHLIFSVSKMA